MKDHDKAAYPEPPRKTPVADKQTSLPNPAVILTNLFYYSVDVPVSTFKGALDSIRSNNKSVYYHQKFRRVPELTDCENGDYLLEERLQSGSGDCEDSPAAEGSSYKQNCAKEIEQFEETSNNFQLRYGDLGAYASGRKCLMKQKERMMADQAQTS
ncbi:hypothetical protein JOQ06_010297 [Pogonophryne albipinna]|uniref:NADH dehydrogenase [ubiquinone] 1 beta subcomplex subunit 10 n=1 Tax=Pogonophryne albipinna TaxID=1090488 RepID=A0AAD6AVL0_9TELE|nr:hypothetical protein JOQ06_010297 [Pogonophryne albipinna]